jgi:hypothetical protein
MNYKARWYDPSLGRFSQADTIVPGASDPRAWDRYAYVKNNPINYIDLNGNEPWYIHGWNYDYMFSQGQSNTCAVVATAVALSILTNRQYTLADVQPFFAHTYDMYIGGSGTTYMFSQEKNKQSNIAPGVIPWELEIVLNTFFPGVVKARYSHGNRADLLKNLQNGFPTMVYLAFPPEHGFGHVLLVVGYDPDTEEFQFFNPAYGKEYTEKEIVGQYGYIRGDTSFDQLWAADTLWISGNSMVTITNNYGIGGGVGMSKRLWN